MFRNLGAPEIILILVVLVLLFGAKRLPDAARSLGRSMRIFKSEVKEMGKDDDEHPTQQAQTPREQIVGIRFRVGVVDRVGLKLTKDSKLEVHIVITFDDDLC